MDSLVIFAGIVGALCVASVVYVLWIALSGFFEPWRPAELRGAKLMMVEQDLVAGSGAYALFGRPDRAYRTRQGQWVPVDLKTRAGFRVFDSDIAQLSLQAWQLRRTGRMTGESGYVVVNDIKSGKKKALRVSLGSDGYCEALMNRYHEIVRNADAARRNRGPKCKSCGQRRRCE